MRRLLTIAVLWSLPAWGAATHVQTVRAHSYGATHTISVNIPSPTIGNSLKVAAFAAGGFDEAGGTFNTPTDNQTNTYVIGKQGPAVWDGNEMLQAMIACAPVVSSGGTFTVTVTATTSLGNLSMVLIASEMSGSSCTLNGTDSKQQASSTAPACYATTGIATTNSADTIFAAVAYWGAGTPAGITAGTTGATYTIATNGAEQDGDNYGGAALEYYVASSTGTFTPSFSNTHVSAATCVSAAYEENGPPPTASMMIKRIPGDYPATRSGLASAISAAGTYQAAHCIPYIIEIAAGTTIEVSADAVHLPAKSCKQYVIIRSSGAGAFTDGVRLNPSTQSGSLATIKAVDYVGALIDIAESAATSYWRFEGIDFWIAGGTAGYPNYYALLIDDNPGKVSVDPSTRPHHFEIKHCWLRGTPGARNALNGVGANGSNIRILDSYFEAWAGGAYEGRSIGIAKGQGPLEVRNNRLSGASQNSLSGGDNMPAGILPSFLTFVGNRMGRDPYMRYMTGAADPTTACREGQYWQNTATAHDWICNSSGVWVDQAGLTGYGGNIQKVIWESKASRGVRIFGNLFEDAWYPITWTDSYFIEFNQTPQYTLEPWITTTDSRIWGNVFRRGNGIIRIGSPYANIQPCTQWNPTACMYTGANNLHMWDNLGYDLANAKDYYAGNSGTGYWSSWEPASFDMEYRNNTYVTAQGVGSGTAGAAGYMWRVEDVANAVQTKTVYGQNILRDNVAVSTSYGLVGEIGNGGTWMGECTLALGMKANEGGYDARGNVWTNDLQWHYASQGWGGTKSPLVCEYHQYDPTTDFSQWWQHSTVVQNTWDTVVSSSTYKVLPAYQGTGSDGRDPGANIDFVNWATAGASDGSANPSLDYRFRTARATSATTALLNITAPSTAACTITLATDNTYASPVGSVSQVRLGRDVRASVTGLTTGTYYWVQVSCDSQMIETIVRM